MISNHQRTARTAISEADPADSRNNSGVMRKRLEERTGRSGDAPTTPTAEQLAAMTTDQQQDAANAWWLSTLPPPGPAPTTQAVKSLSDLLDG